MESPKATRLRAGLRCVLLLLLLGVAWAGCDDSAASREESPPEAPRLTEVEMVALMEGHYGSAISAHDALIRADLEGVRRRLGEIPSRELPAAAPESWKPFDETFREAARTAAGAPDFDAAAAGMGAVAEACGACHAHAARGPVYRRPLPAEGESVVEDAMLLHQWATERLWEGVTGPWDEAWARGARALAESRVFAAKPEGAAVAPSLLAQEEAMRGFGRTALLTSGLHARAEVYGRLLATCGRCHREAGVLFAAVE